MTFRFNSMALIGSALASVLVCYTISLSVSAERAAVESVRGRMARDLRDIRMLQAELRTRARLPELQRWNEQVLALAPPKAEQFLGDPVQLASFEAGAVTPDAVDTPAVAMAAIDRRPVPAPMVAPSPVRQVAYVAPAPVAAPVARRQVAALDLGLGGDLAGSIAAAAAQERAGFRKVALR